MAIFRVFLLVVTITFFPAQSYAGWFGKNKKPVMIYDIEKSIYDTLTEAQRNHIIEVYNGHKAEREKYQAEIASYKEKTEELEKQKQQVATLQKEKDELQVEINKLELKIESQDKALSNFLTVSQDLLEARSKGKNYKEKQKRDKFFPKIVSIHRGFNSTNIKLENDTLIEVSPFEKEKIDTWMTGQTVELTKGDGLVYILNLTNLDTENSVSVKIKETP